MDFRRDYRSPSLSAIFCISISILYVFYVYLPYDYNAIRSGIKRIVTIQIL